MRIEQENILHFEENMYPDGSKVYRRTIKYRTAKGEYKTYTYENIWWRDEDKLKKTTFEHILIDFSKLPESADVSFHEHEQLKRDIRRKMIKDKLNFLVSGI